MKKQKTYSQLILFFIFQVLTLGCQQAQNPYETYFTEVKNLGFSGEVVLRQAGEIVFKGTSHDSKTGNELFYIASLSKTFTAIAIAKLAQTGYLNIDEQINKYLTGVPEALKKITIKHLLSHTSGIGSFGWNPASNDWQIMTKEQAVTGILNQALIAPIGKEFIYNNANYILLSAIIESTSDGTYQQYLKEVILELGDLKNTYFGFELADESIRVRDNFDYQQKLPNYISRPKSWLRVGGGDIISSIDDMSRFIDLLSRGKIVSNEWVEKISTPLFNMEPNYGYGYGWHIRTGNNGRKVLFHSGSFGGYNCEWRWYPDSQKSLVIFTNNSHPSSAPEKISNRLVSLSPENEKADHAGHRPLTQNLQRNLIGRYVNSNEGSIEIKALNGNTLLFLTDSQIRSELSATGYNESITKSDSLSKIFLSELEYDVKKAFTKILPPEELDYVHEYISEWTNTMPSNGFSINSIVSIQLDKNITRSYVSISKRGRVYHYAITWKFDRLIGTLPNATIEPVVLNLVTKNNKLYAFDWSNDQFLACSFKNEQGQVSIDIQLGQSTVSFYQSK